jgi:hypothetical protein
MRVATFLALCAAPLVALAKAPAAEAKGADTCVVIYVWGVPKT